MRRPGSASATVAMRFRADEMLELCVSLDVWEQALRRSRLRLQGEERRKVERHIARVRNLYRRLMGARVKLSAPPVRA